jgi:Flp pilus assembly pilin Flp
MRLDKTTVEVIWMINKLIFEEEGQTLVEYGLLIGLLALVAVAAVTLFGRTLRDNLYGPANNVLTS